MMTRYFLILGALVGIIAVLPARAATAGETAPTAQISEQKKPAPKPETPPRPKPKPGHPEGGDDNE